MPLPSFQTSLFLFRRDFRLEDNTGLLFALEKSQQVIPAFIFTPEQIEHNPYRSDHCLVFMIESLKDLQNQLKQRGANLYLFQGSYEKVLQRCISELKIDALVVNRDYTPYSKLRDGKLETICKTEGIRFFSFDDLLLHPPEETLKSDGTPYTVFTPYFRNALKLSVPAPRVNRYSNYYTKEIPFSEKSSFMEKIIARNPGFNSLRGGRDEALQILNSLSFWKQYETCRDFPSQNTTQLSAYLKFTVCSPREVHMAISKHLHSQHELIRSLYWRDFFTGIAWFFPHVFNGSFRPKFDKLSWSSDRASFKKWCQGETGFPIVDAGMREMNQTGFMHNRVRMIAASFLIKDLHINWKWGEKYFAQTLIDYDPSVNNGNWQWVASTGSDAQPYFRIFNPWTQQKKFDADCKYIKTWVPELSQCSPKEIHSWGNLDSTKEGSPYPFPMVDHEKEAKKALSAYRRLS